MKKLYFFSILLGLFLIGGAWFNNTSTNTNNSSTNEFVTENLKANAQPCECEICDTCPCVCDGGSGGGECPGGGFAAAFKKAFDAMYDTLYETVKDKCPGGTLSCVDITTELSIPGFASVSATFYFHKN